MERMKPLQLVNANGQFLQDIIKPVLLERIARLRRPAKTSLQSLLEMDSRLDNLLIGRHSNLTMGSMIANPWFI